ncbi:SpoIIE family protein phosphatase [Streptomyces pactum]|uniref:SpoIIE family protein phosphatase n=1 Tax=Streptomyces pactum TaxID=68249 RepID=A0ABS0NU74_9ACTN|nr:GAF domain-containing SpoIIE family protein phosphatase [Streptomyces pactum]MBH5338758.1 SpoIIE family protein phosphatase [Streptomyces pactum]
MTSEAQRCAPPAPADERRRLRAVRRYHILDTPPDGVFDRIAGLAARFFDVPIATVAIVDEDRVWFKSAHGLHGVREVPREPGLYATAVAHGVPHVVPDTLADPRTADHPLVRGEPGIRFYASAPITTADGHHLGSVDVLDTRPRRVSREQIAALQDFAALVMDELELRLSAMRTVSSERALRTDAERLARTLQRTLLPPALPQVPGLCAAAAYHTASADEVGGDFYDLFPLDDDRWAFFLGDVCGKGADAAALTSLTRYTLRAAAIYDPEPRTALANLDSVLKGEYQGDNPRYCTALFGVLLPEPGGTFSVTLASGGHPSALALRADGTVEPLATPGGQLIGLLPRPQFTGITTRLAPGDAVLLYTDGLTEARHPDGTMLGEEGLSAHLSAAAWQDADGLLAVVDDLLTALGAGVSDDTALLALSVPPVPHTTQENR